MEKLILKAHKLESLKPLQFAPGVGVYVAKGNTQSNYNPYKKIEPTEKDKPLYKSALGTFVFCNFEIQPGSWTDDKGVVHKWRNPNHKDGLLVFDTVLMMVDQPKNIVKTKVQGKNGSVKEYISDDDYMINIRLLIVGKPGVMPLDEVSALKKALSAPVPLAINSRWLQNLGIDSIVVEHVSYPQVEGEYSMQAVEIRASSDEPIELIIK
jgi:hypothetical protein